MSSCLEAFAAEACSSAWGQEDAQVWQATFGPSSLNQQEGESPHSLKRPSEVRTSEVTMNSETLNKTFGVSSQPLHFS